MQMNENLKNELSLLRGLNDSVFCSCRVNVTRDVSVSGYPPDLWMVSIFLLQCFSIIKGFLFSWFQLTKI